MAVPCLTDSRGCAPSILRDAPLTDSAWNLPVWSTGCSLACLLLSPGGRPWVDLEDCLRVAYHGTAGAALLRSASAGWPISHGPLTGLLPGVGHSRQELQHQRRLRLCKVYRCAARRGPGARLQARLASPCAPHTGTLLFSMLLAPFCQDWYRATPFSRCMHLSAWDSVQPVLSSPPHTPFLGLARRPLSPSRAPHTPAHTLPLNPNQPDPVV